VAALYRKYRPQDFEEVVGQEAIVRTLKNAIASQQVRQAYLFADDIREIRERVVLQPAEGRYKVYILDEAHQLTDAAWNALLKLIEEPPPHLVFVFCTTDLSKVLPTVRSRCQTFVFQRPRLPELVRLLRRVADGEGIDVPDQALALIARGARGSYRDAVSTLDQLAAATEKQVTVQAVLQLLGAVEEEALFRLCDLVVDRDTAGALTFIEELSEQGQDLGRLVTDLLEHLRHVMLVQHMGEVPEALPVTEETRERLRAQANQLGEAAVIRLIDLLAVAVEDMRQGGDPRLPLELALVKVTRPGADLSRESLSYRMEQLEQGHVPMSQAVVSDTVTKGTPDRDESVAPAPPSVELEQLQEAWQRTIVPAVEERSIPAASVLREAHPAQLTADMLTIEFPKSASFHRQLAEEEKNSTLLKDALYEVTGRRLGVAFAEGETRSEPAADEDEPLSEEHILELVKETFDAREREE
jgi:DNA polymerase-3 subunit gamma/tau